MPCNYRYLHPVIFLGSLCLDLFFLCLWSSASANDSFGNSTDYLQPEQENLGSNTLSNHNSPDSSFAQSTVVPTLNLDEQNIGAFPDIISEVVRFDYIGNPSIYSESELNTIVRFEEEYLGRPTTVSQLLQAISRINEAYVKPEDEQGNELGYITSGAFIPLDEQTNPIDQLQRGVVRIAIVEGRLEDVRVSGLTRLREDYVKGRILSRVRQPLQQGDLVEALQLLQLDPLIESVSADLALGSDLGLSLLNIDIKESDTNQVVLGIDNNRSPSIGTLRLRGGYVQSNLLGFGDRLALFYEATEGSEGINDVSYELPINPSGGALSLSASFLDARIIERPFDAIDITSPTEDYTFTYRQPLLREIDDNANFREVAAGLTVSHKRNDTSLLGFPFRLSPGADERGRTRSSALQAFVDYTQQSDRDAFSSQLSVRVGFSGFGSTINGGRDEEGFRIPDSNFLSGRFQAQYVAAQGDPNIQWVLRTDIQLADRALLPIEQFGIGGQSTVRGYRQNALTTDNGAVVSAEYRWPVPGVETLKLAPFFDVGLGWNSGGRPNPDTTLLTGLGVGILWEDISDLNIRFDWGVPLNRIPNSRAETWQENGLYFTIQYAPRF